MRMSSAYNLCKWYGHRSGHTKRCACSAPKLCDTWSVFLKDGFKNDNSEEIKLTGDKNQKRNIPACKEIKRQLDTYDRDLCTLN